VLVRREVGVHRYAAALEHAQPLGDRARAERGYCLYRLGRFEEALALLDPALPDQALCVFDTLELLGRQAEARAILPEVARTLGADDPEVLVRRGRIAAADGELAAAEALFRRALDGDPVQAAAWFGLGQALVRGGRRDEALAALQRHRELVPLLDALEFAQKSLDLAPNHAPNHANVGDAERALGRIERAEGRYRRAEVLAADDEVTPNALRHARLLAEDLRDVDGAVVVLGAAFRRVPDVRLLVRQGDVLLAADRAGEAAEAFGQAAAHRPDDAEIAGRLATARAAAESGR
jgi:tetratricopeptide (TPR) repeat protein